MTDVNHVNYVKRGLSEKQVVTIEIFGSPIDCVDGMMRLKDIQDAYLDEIGGNVRTTSSDKWLELDSTKKLLDYLPISGFYPPDIRVLTQPKGRRGGNYACRELIHSYASWLDVRYSAHVLRAFDQLVQGNFAEAHKVATKVALPFVKMEWKARENRLNAMHMDPAEHFKFLVSDIYHSITGGILIDPVKFRNHIYANIGESLIFERMLNGLEMIWKLQDSEEAVEFTVDHFKEDSEFPHFKEIVKEYYEHND